MIVTKLMGGIGNQMFEYAAGYALARRLGVELQLDIRELDAKNIRSYELAVFSQIQTPSCDESTLRQLSGKPEPFLKRKIRRFRKLPFTPPQSAIVEDLSKNYDPCLEAVNTSAKDYYLDGYWQNERYFLEYKSEIQNLFSVTPEKCSTRFQNYFDTINKVDHSLSIHIRRGDYLSNANATQVHGLCRKDYYATAVEKAFSILGSPSVFVFSDQPELVPDILPEGLDYTLVTCTPDDPPYEDMLLMSYAKHNIIANSSYSWWGAWLNKNVDKTVIAPGRWFLAEEHETGAKEIVPASWFRVGGCS